MNAENKKINCVYCITEKNTGMMYIGSHKNFNNVGVSYFTGSSNKNFVKSFRNNPELCNVKIISRHYTRGKATEAEDKILLGIPAIERKNYFNKIFSAKSWKGYTPDGEARRKISEAHKGEKSIFFGVPKSDEFKMKLSKKISGKNHHYWNKSRPKESIKKQSDSMSGKNHPNWNKKIPYEVRQKISLSAKANKIKCYYCDKVGGISAMKTHHIPRCSNNPNRIKKTQQLLSCTRCNKTGGASNMKRYHFDNCKSDNLLLT